VPEWRDVAARDARCAAQLPAPALRTVEEKLEHVASGRGTVVLPRSTAVFCSRPDVVTVPISDLGPNPVCLARGRRTPQAADPRVAAIARDHASAVVSG
jgi:hypothetical protein